MRLPLFVLYASCCSISVCRLRMDVTRGVKKHTAACQAPGGWWRAAHTWRCVQRGDASKTHVRADRIQRPPNLTGVSIEGMRAVTALQRFCGSTARQALLGGGLRTLGRVHGRSVIVPAIALPSLLLGDRSATQHRTMATNPKHTNRLAQSESPYLLQHAHNPVRAAAAGGGGAWASVAASLDGL